ncbi:hypothetical protein ACFV7R_34375 [Streptomyces sp. NPDC059866]|uniref:hypothetical protein n=1 Tax=Streptomyces sp. NPDC059866 TaxID=3346978 RepID=UPI00364C954E
MPPTSPTPPAPGTPAVPLSTLLAGPGLGLRQLAGPCARIGHLAMWGKKAGSGLDDPTFLQPARPMSALGGYRQFVKPGSRDQCRVRW